MKKINKLLCLQIIIKFIIIILFKNIYTPRELFIGTIIFLNKKSAMDFYENLEYYRII